MPQKSIQRVAVVGLGYVGLPTAAVLALHGFEVIGVDVNERAVDSINDGRPHIVEPDLDNAVQGAVATGRLRAVTTAEPADAFVIAVPTPLDDGNRPVVRFVEQATDSIAPVLADGNLVIVESTSPPGTTLAQAQRLARLRPDLRIAGASSGDHDISMAYCPERVLPGRAMIELIVNDRIIGGIDPASAAHAQSFYRTFVQGECLVTDATTAETVKLSENAFRDVNIAFANELAAICEHLGVDVWEAIRLANRHPRVTILQPGPGVGGHCIPVDPWFLADAFPDAALLIPAARSVNDGRPARVARSIGARLDASGGRVVGLLGLAFKADIDDLRGSPAVEIARLVAAERDVEVLVVEPHISELPTALTALGNLALVPVETVVTRADVVAVLVDHALFRLLDRDIFGSRHVVDVRGVWR